LICVGINNHRRAPIPWHDPPTIIAPNTSCHSHRFQRSILMESGNCQERKNVKEFKRLLAMDSVETD
ncbi:MAG TPA: hypothetical protein PKK12_04385, partial [Candidatus Aminicenantes bacterium]|nr:hypothetical protein [Candidatus Aminicenantes bacterium]